MDQDKNKVNLLVDGVQVNAGFLFWLTSRQESDSGNGGWNGALKRGHCCPGDVFWTEFDGVRLTGCDHVGFQEGAFQVYVVVSECLKNKRFIYGHILLYKT